MDALRDTPTAITASLNEAFGLNSYGHPNWRVVLAQNHTRKSYGVWHEFDDGNWEQFGIEPDGKWKYNPIHAKNVVEGVKDEPMFPVKGWIIERWFPASAWGPRAAWEIKMGPYPEEGEYWIMGPAHETLPEIGDIKGAIQVWEHEWAARPKTLDAVFQMFIAEEKAQKEAEIKKLDDELNAFFRGEIKPLFNSTSLAAQAVRNEAAESAGVRSHIGAGQ